ncbi:hypothetical protein PISMIDRAFT_686356 [Pisolithus microcarpus 441]|uniref:Uncharacterized protein n=1 Tax=Pisolithus microcarpus 441 TaxID=765257 RepID=A0A0C9Z205_9AGAM|nr:hypothetical protein PISMIDRAFT_686356 [Pisolithus microcarpus 441]
MANSLACAERILEEVNETIRDQEGRERLGEVSEDLRIGRDRLDLTATDSSPRSSENSSTEVYRRKKKVGAGYAFYSAAISFHFSTRAKAEARSCS